MKYLKRYPEGAEHFEALANLLVDRDGEFLHGFNAEELKRDEVDHIIKSEHRRRSAQFEDLYRTKEKYDGYAARVRDSREFAKDWQILKEKFPRSLGTGKRVLRVEQDTKWQSDRLRAQFTNPTFRDAFEFFCWKWFLDGMDGDDPIVTKLSFDITPFGTSIFIPGYWSFDPKRDIRWKELITFHQSRGVVKRQGAVFEAKRRKREEKEWKVLDAEDASDTLKERGQARVERAIRVANLPTETDPAQVYRLAREAKKKKGRGRRGR
jgi:hypothetical protein